MNPTVEVYGKIWWDGCSTPLFGDTHMHHMRGSRVSWTCLCLKHFMPISPTMKPYRSEIYNIMNPTIEFYGKIWWDGCSTPLFGDTHMHHMRGSRVSWTFLCVKPFMPISPTMKAYRSEIYSLMNPTIEFYGKICWDGCSTPLFDDTHMHHMRGSRVS
jgi:hypothetical protein